MSKKVLFAIFATLIFLLAAAGCYLGVKAVDKKRVSLATYYENTSKTAVDDDQKLTYLIKSDALMPLSDKKVSIALLLLNKEEVEKSGSVPNLCSK